MLFIACNSFCYIPRIGKMVIHKVSPTSGFFVSGGKKGTLIQGNTRLWKDKGTCKSDLKILRWRSLGRSKGFIESTCTDTILIVFTMSLLWEHLAVHNQKNEAISKTLVLSSIHSRWPHLKSIIVQAVLLKMFILYFFKPSNLWGQ